MLSEAKEINYVSTLSSFIRVLDPREELVIRVAFLILHGIAHTAGTNKWGAKELLII